MSMQSGMGCNPFINITWKFMEGISLVNNILLLFWKLDMKYSSRPDCSVIKEFWNTM